MKSFSMLQLGICVVIPFATIYFYNIYKTVWTRSRASQLFILVLQLVAGEILAYVALLWTTPLTNLELLFALVLLTLIAGIGIVGGRACLRVVRDLSAWMSGKATSDQDIKTLILGAGENAILYLRQASFADQQKAPRRVIGLVDDNPALQRKVVYGYPVLGTFSELEKIIEDHGVGELIFSHHYSDELRASILALQPKYDLLIRDFIFVLKDMNQQGACRGIVKPYSVAEMDCRNLCIHQDHRAIIPAPTGSEGDQTATGPN